MLGQSGDVVEEKQIKSNGSSHWRQRGIVRYLLRLRKTSLAGNWRKLAERVNVHLLGPVNRPRLRRFHQADDDSGATICYMIAVTGTLAYLIPCLRLIQSHVRVVIIDNGLKQWERACIRRYFPRLPIFSLYCVGGTMYSHGRVLNLLFSVNKQVFTILDHDTFIFDPELLKDPELADNEFIAALWCYRNERANALVPRTHFMVFNTPIISEVMARYGVGQQVYQWLPSRLWSVVRRAGFAPDNFPKAYMQGFDATNLVTALCMADGFKARCLPMADGQAEHVGGTSHRQDGLQDYLMLRFLAFCDDPELAQRYGYPAATGRAADALLSEFSGADGAALRRYADQLLDSLHRCLNSEPASPSGGCVRVSD